MEKKTKTVINIGWQAAESLAENFENYAAKGFILTEMNDRTFIFTEDEPKKLKFRLYKGKESDKDMKALAENGWKELCSYENYHMLVNENIESAENEEKTAAKKTNRGTSVSCALLWAVFIFLDFRYIPASNETLAALRFILAEVFACFFVYAVIKAFRAGN